MAGPPLQLNDNHRNTLLAAIRYMDGLLGEALAGLSPGDDGSIFSPTVPDASPVQRKVLADQAARLRRALRAALDACAIPVCPPTIGAFWNFRCFLVSMDIALEDLGPEHLRGYGAIDETAVAGIAVLQAQIRTILVELQTYLESDFGGDLTARLGRLDQTRDEVRLLRELERIITAHGLVELRGALTRLLDRLEKNWWTVAFIGRVSSGKSSLLNHLLATDVLPAGVTPITAVPIRIVYGAAAMATIFLATEKPRRIPAAELGDFASEERNPGNARQVTDILLELPSVRLTGDMCFVDTPGLGSLATAGAAQTMAFLPRCDLGVLLLDGAATPDEEDIAVARALLENGAEVLLVLSKADLLVTADQEKMLAYARRQFAAALGQEVLIAPVSVVPGQAALAEQWFATELTPRQARHRELATAALRRKIGALQEAVTAALASRTGFVQAAPAPLISVDPEALSAARAAIEKTHRGLHDIAYEETPSNDAVLAAIATVLASAPGDPPMPGKFAGAVANELGREAARLGNQFDSRLRSARDAAAQALTTALGESKDGASLLAPFARPLFDPAPVLAASHFSITWRRWPIAAIRRAALCRHLRAQFGDKLDDALRAYARALVRWSERYLDDLTLQFNAQAGLAEARGAAPESSGATTEAIGRDLEILRKWNMRPAQPC